MRSLPAVAGVLVLGFGLVVFMSTFRETRTHVYLERSGDRRFALEIPRHWTSRPASLSDGGELVEGPLPSGARGRILLSEYRDPDLLKPSPEPRPREAEDWEEWSQEGWRYTCFNPKTWRGFFWCRMVRKDQVFSALTSSPERPSRDDFEVLERCLRSMRAIGR